MTSAAVARCLKCGSVYFAWSFATRCPARIPPTRTGVKCQSRQVQVYLPAALQQLFDQVFPTVDAAAAREAAAADDVEVLQQDPVGAPVPPRAHGAPAVHGGPLRPPQRGRDDDPRTRGESRPPSAGSSQPGGVRDLPTRASPSAPPAFLSPRGKDGEDLLPALCRLFWNGRWDLLRPEQQRVEVLRHLRDLGARGSISQADLDQVREKLLAEGPPDDWTGR